MKWIRLWLVIGLLVAAALSSLAQEPADKAPDDTGSKPAPAATPAPDASQPADANGGDDEFIPSEEIGADEEVTFPVDI